MLENQAHPLYCSINLFYTILACFDFSGGFTLSIEVNILAAHGWFMVACFWDEILLVVGSLRHKKKTLNFIQKYFDFPSQCGQSFQRWPWKIQDTCYSGAGWSPRLVQSSFFPKHVYHRRDIFPVRRANMHHEVWLLDICGYRSRHRGGRHTHFLGQVRKERWMGPDQSF